MEAFLVSKRAILFANIGSCVAIDASLLTYTLVHVALLPSIAFTAISILSQIEFTLAIVPELITQAIDAWVSVRRIESYLDVPEKLANPTHQSDCISFANTSLTWPSNQLATRSHGVILEDLSLRFPPSELSIIAGKTGSGKNMLLVAILGELDVLTGTVQTPSRPHNGRNLDKRARLSDWNIDSEVAYVVQTPWIEAGSIRINILFGLPYQGRRYQQVLAACALPSDLVGFPYGDLTKIGSCGVNLSGGQRWRIPFARTLYSRAGILVLDDILSSVDKKVGREIFEGGLMGELRTRILVTHHLDLCATKAALIVVLEGGKVRHVGNADSLGAFKRAQDAGEIMNESSNMVVSTAKNKDIEKGPSMKKRFDGLDEADVNSSKPVRFTEEEGRKTRRFKFTLYKHFVASPSLRVLWILAIVGFVGTAGLEVVRTWWQTSAQLEDFNNLRVALHEATDHDTVAFYLIIYVSLLAAAILVGTIKYLYVFAAYIRTSRKLFSSMMYRILNAELQWLDTVPASRALNRCTADFSILESRIGNDFAEVLYTSLELLAIITAGTMASPLMLLLAAISVAIVVWVGRLYLEGAREVKRLEAVAQSPVLELFDTVAAGIRSTLDRYSTAYMHFWLFNQWMSFRLNILAAAFAIVLAATILLSRTGDSSLLSLPVSRLGSAFSQGQRQLLSLAQVLILRPRVVILDEATSAVDMETDAFVQRTLREKLRGCTLLVVAHRLSTVRGFEAFLVLREGKVVGYGAEGDVVGRESRVRGKEDTGGGGEL
ncbi:MAG: hypothetical protein Q9219_002065 [cf. Caloplaca sp. 3 TL-2023]